jgi:hypothetical protein
MQSQPGDAGQCAAQQQVAVIKAPPALASPRSCPGAGGAAELSLPGDSPFASVTLQAGDAPCALSAPSGVSNISFSGGSDYSAGSDGGATPTASPPPAASRLLPAQLPGEAWAADSPSQSVHPNAYMLPGHQPPAVVCPGPPHYWLGQCLLLGGYRPCDARSAADPAN